MKFTTIYLGENKIELFNSILGKETVKVNEEIVSSKYSMSGAEHLFSITENDENIECKLVIGFGFSGVVIDLYKGGEPIIESPKSGCSGFLLMVIVIAFVLGLLDSIF